MSGGYTIWKEVLPPHRTQSVLLPRGAKILCAREQFNQVCIWFRCDPDQPRESRVIAICGTGHSAPPPDEARYVGTVSLHGGNVIMHVFEKGS